MSDNEARALIGSALDLTLLVEAAAGTGKTTELVSRILAVIAAGRARIEDIVAVTFTEKAAGELKLRLRTEIERQREASTDGNVKARLLEALRRLEEAHVSTIHGFCADLLRERPVEARVDPQFQVLTEDQARRLHRRTFRAWLQEQLADPPEGIRRSLCRPVPFDDEDGPIERLERVAWDLVTWRDFPSPWRMEPFARETAIDMLVSSLHALAKLTEGPTNPSDNFFLDTRGLRRLSDEIRRTRQAEAIDYDRWEASLIALLRGLRRSRKGSGAWYKPEVSRTLLLDARDSFIQALELFERGADADLAARLHSELVASLERYKEQKAREGALDFIDLLLRARDLVRDNDDVRREFQARFTHVFVDEFQDTDPLQAEVLLLLSAGDPHERDWRRVAPQPGKLFIVGDPKQSIYRFRRADVGIYQEVRRTLVERGATPLELTRSFRAVPDIQAAINTAFSRVMTGDPVAMQADYVALDRHREARPGQPAVVALPVPRPYSATSYGAPRVKLQAIEASLPIAVGHFVNWLLNESGWKVAEKRVPTPGERANSAGGVEEWVDVKDRHVCLLFRRFVSWRRDVTRPYLDAIESHGIAHLLVGGKTFHDREEVDAIRTALTAIEWPDDELSVFAALRGSFFAIGDEDLLEYRSLFRHFHPFRVPPDLPEALRPIGEALVLLRALHVDRNTRPVADTIWRLLEATRAHAGLVLRQAGEQALANVLYVAELARRYEAGGGISFRGFLEELAEAADRGQGEEAPILEEGSDGVRLMTVHKAKGLEFPVVVLADMTAKLLPFEASRYIDAPRGLCALKVAGWKPIELLEHETEETAREVQEGIRVSYVAATRARDVLVVPAVGDTPFDGGWVSPMNAAIYPPVGSRRQAEAGPGCPAFKSRDSVFERPNADAASEDTVCPGLHRFGPRPEAPARRPQPAARSKQPDTDQYSVVWWDPSLLVAERDHVPGLRREELITKDAPPHVVSEGMAAYKRWQESRAATIERASRPSLVVRRAGEWVAAADAEALDAAGIELVELARLPRRPAGRRFGVLVHAVLARVPLDAVSDVVEQVAEVQGRVLGADAEEVEAAARAAARVLASPLLARARRAHDEGRCRRETPVTLTTPAGVLVEGIVDLAFEDEQGWTVVDFKTDQELSTALDRYKRQVSLYVEAIRRATARDVRGVLMRV
jgi:ATP-dependent exoDNAse (exonuclease V) beta subunit